MKKRGQRRSIFFLVCCARLYIFNESRRVGTPKSTESNAEAFLFIFFYFPLFSEHVCKHVSSPLLVFISTFFFLLSLNEKIAHLLCPCHGDFLSSATNQTFFVLLLSLSLSSEPSLLLLLCCCHHLYSTYHQHYQHYNHLRLFHLTTKHNNNQNTTHEHDTTVGARLQSTRCTFVPGHWRRATSRPSRLSWSITQSSTSLEERSRSSQRPPSVTQPMSTARHGNPQETAQNLRDW
ncbi:MAG: hypothetical protein JOS17DRAFT_239666 [Linnemannia elongata]|nr:MAG: hypothetical protein JOS17DRAFT_239666 [Linnemannia elongata]